MVGAEGFEPPTPWSQTRCATKLRYAPSDVTKCIVANIRMLVKTFDEILLKLLSFYIHQLVHIILGEFTTR